MCGRTKSALASITVCRPFPVPERVEPSGRPLGAQRTRTVRRFHPRDRAGAGVRPRDRVCCMPQVGMARRAITTMFGDRSKPSTRHPRSARSRLMRPAPHPASRTVGRPRTSPPERTHRPWRDRLVPRHAGIRQVAGVVLRQHVVCMADVAMVERIRHGGNHVGPIGRGRARLDRATGSVNVLTSHDPHIRTYPMSVRLSPLPRGRTTARRP